MEGGGAKFALFLDKEAFLGQCYGGRYCGGRNLHCFLKRRLFWDSMIAADRGRTVAKKVLRQAQFIGLAKRGKGEDKNKDGKKVLVFSKKKFLVLLSRTCFFEVAVS